MILSQYIIKYPGNHTDCTVLRPVFQQNKGQGRQTQQPHKVGRNAVPAQNSAHASDSEMKSVSSKASRRSWTRLILQVYEVGPRSFGEDQNYTQYVRNVKVICNSIFKINLIEDLKSNQITPYRIQLQK
jgi:hypothetical protein